MSKIGILGGSFDPIHKEHIEIIKAAMMQLELDSFFIIPTKRNPWKDTDYASTKQRVEMIAIAIENMPNVEMNPIELEVPGEGKSYTLDTLLKLTKQHPNDTFYFLMGMDQVGKFDQWYGAQEISVLVQLVAFSRVGYTDNENLEKFHFIRLQHQASDISSTAIRNGSITDVDPKVLSYIVNQGLYLDTMLVQTMSKKRFIHTRSMAQLAKEIATCNHLSARKAYVAGMLHDIAKEMPDKEARSLMEKHYPQHIHTPVPIWHQWLSAYLAETVYQVKDPEILQAIRHHTTASVGMRPLDMCIYCADKYDPSRKYDSSKEIALCKKNIQEGFVQCLKDFYAYAKKENREIDACFFPVYKQFVEGE